MSQETMIWLNQFTLIGFTDKRGNAWHYREDAQGTEPNHYPGAIPVDDVLRRLFNFTAVERPLYFQDADGTFHAIEDRKAIVTDDRPDVLGVFKQGYQPHQYQEWLLQNVAALLDDDALQIGSAGLLRNRAQAWVSIEMSENQSVSGFEFRPHLIAASSFDGSLATTDKFAVQAVVCDNTLNAGLSEAGGTYKVKHSKYSAFKLSDAREALQVVFSGADAFAADLENLLAVSVSEKAWQNVLNIVVPLPADDGRGKTVATTKRDKLEVLYKTDERCEPWKGTALGVLQAFNTYNHHFASVRKGVPRVLRNMENVVSGKYDAADSLVMAAVMDSVK